MNTALADGSRLYCPNANHPTMRRALEREKLEHPRTTLAVRILLYVGLVVVLGTLAVGMVGYLFVVAAVGGIAILAGSGTSTLALVGFAVGGVGIAVVVGVGTAVAVRWADRRVVAADRRPDPVEELTERYVDAELDEIEFERRLERALARRRERERTREYERNR